MFNKRFHISTYSRSSETVNRWEECCETVVVVVVVVVICSSTPIRHLFFSNNSMSNVWQLRKSIKQHLYTGRCRDWIAFDRTMKLRVEMCIIVDEIEFLLECRCTRLSLLQLLYRLVFSYLSMLCMFRMVLCLSMLAMVMLSSSTSSRSTWSIHWFTHTITM